MNKLLFTILLLISTQSYACEIPVGKYKLITESHWGVNLEITQNNSFVVTWGAYIAGKPETLETKTYQGKWSCENDVFIFKYELETAQAEYKNSNNYPLGIFEGKKAIVFFGEPDNKKYLTGYNFWPVNKF